MSMSSIDSHKTPTGTFCGDDDSMELKYLSSRSSGPRMGSVIEFNNLSYGIGHKTIVDNVTVTSAPGKMLAILGPSGSGKSTLLDLMAFRKRITGPGEIITNGLKLTHETMSQIGSYVEQDDQHLGVLTVRETLHMHAVEEIIDALGLRNCANQRIGTPIQRGISGGQKRRVTVGCGLVTFPRILFLDEPTSGLDSAAALGVMRSIKSIAKSQGIAVIAAIHSPSIDTLQCFDELLVLAEGKTAFRGNLEDAAQRCHEIGHPIPAYHNPADWMLHLVNNDFGAAGADIRMLHAYYEGPSHMPHPTGAPLATRSEIGLQHNRSTFSHSTKVVSTLCHRAAINYSRNLLAYGIRLGMYLGMGFLLATIWIKLGRSDSKINDRLSVHFFSVAFLAFMSVAGIPAFLEERSVFLRERRNGFYGPFPFVVANTIVSLPFLFMCAVFFSVMVYWSIGLNPGATHFFRFLAFLFLALFAAETQSFLIAALVPIFVAALALAAFVNGFWMCVQGYFIRARSLPRFWYYSFHWMDYQTYAFELLAKNDLVGEVFKCKPGSGPDGSCLCSYPPSAATIAKYGTCAVSGQDVLDYLDIGNRNIVAWTFILVGIIVIYRIALLLALYIRR